MPKHYGHTEMETSVECYANGSATAGLVTFYKHVHLYTVYCGSSASLKFLKICSVVKLYLIIVPCTCVLRMNRKW